MKSGLKSGFLNNIKGLGERRYMDLNIRTKQGHFLSISVATNSTISGVKAAVARNSKVPEDRFSLMYKDEYLDENRSTAQYNIGDHETLVMTLKPIASNSTDESMLKETKQLANPNEFDLGSTSKPCSQPLPGTERLPGIDCMDKEPPASLAKQREDVAKPRHATHERLQKLLKVAKSQPLPVQAKLPVEADAAGSSGILQQKKDIDEVSTTTPSDGDGNASQLKKTANRRQRKLKLAARALAKADVGDHNKVLADSVLHVTQEVPIYASSRSWEKIGIAAADTQVIAAGPPELVQGYLMVPIKPDGAVEWRCLTCKATDVDNVIFEADEAPKNVHETNNRDPKADAALEDETDDDFSIAVLTRKGQQREVKVKKSMSVPDLKKSVSDATRVPVSHLYMTFEGEELQDDLRISNYGICAGSVLQLGTAS